ncbi:MAG TPA: UDP-N-acetylmuramate--L-alanine ligase [Candidatus Solibacter sp.]|jgi:UDP-N-acetylmuramate--alanine ligase|nr:UDP-N-acetylmuramate--L-alanine ligase [Candidatus Solibacter sp.]
MKVHLVGIGGAGMSALAHLYLERGDAVSGSDTAASGVTELLSKAGARVALGHVEENVGDAHLVVVSTAAGDDNPEVRAARRRGLQVVSRGRAAAELAATRREVAVAGTHGKTTTTTMVAAALDLTDPMVISGGRLPGSDYNSKPGAGPFAVVEADESDGSFLELTPEVGVVTNIEADHLDRYRDVDAIRDAFERFAARVTSTLVGCVDDPGAGALLAATAGATVGYGFGPAEVRGSGYHVRERGSAFTLDSPWGHARVELTMTGRHNAANALGALAAGLVLNRPLDELVRQLATAELPGRRLELVAEVGGGRVYDDYAHHPTEVAATLSAARELCSGKLVCVFQPHRYNRLHAMMEDFAACFGAADEVLLLPVYPAGEQPIEGATSAALAAAIHRLDPGRKVELLAGLDDLAPALRSRLGPGDVAVCMGAGDIYQATRRLRPAV